ncbi:MAG: GNAT family N-acetyltransferase [Deltaproteobacteria bacterium]|nr:GNAT family N-acetyltransferase [Deltaproteobacteria bacterium]
MKPKDETLKDGTTVHIRKVTSHDLDRLMAFYNDLPGEDRRYLKFDVTDREAVRRRLRQMRGGRLLRIAALSEDAIVGDGVLEFSPESWLCDHAEVRVLVARPFQHRGVGSALMRELYFMAIARGVHKLVGMVARPQHAAIAICHKLGFREQVLIPDYVRDTRGEHQDLVVLIADIHDLWHELEWLYKDQDMRRYQ